MNRLTDFKTNRPKETNFQHYENEIRRIGVDDVAVVNGEVTCCSGTNCTLCSFNCLSYNDGCDFNKTDWLYEEYKEDIYLTTHEYNVLAALGYGYIVRDQHNQLFYFENPPSKKEGCWESEPGYVVNLDFIQSCTLPFIKYESSIWSIDQLLKLDVKNI